MISKPDGSNYSVGGVKSLQSYRPGGSDIDLFNRWDIEQIHLAGSPVIIYTCFIDTNYDQLYMESIDSIIAQEGFELYAQFQPVRPVQELGAFGIDSNDEVLLNFNISEWKSLIGEMPKIKSLVFSKWDSTWWEIVQNDQEKPYKLWTKYRLQVVTKKFQPSRSDIQPTRKDSGDNTISVY